MAQQRRVRVGGTGAMPTGDLPGWAFHSGQDFTTPAAVGQVGAVYGTDMRGYNGFADTSGNGVYTPDQVLSVADSALTWRLRTIGGAPRVAAPVPFGYSGLLYGRYSIRLRTTAATGYKIAFLLWPTSDDWIDGEVDFPEVGNLGERAYPATKRLGDLTSTFLPAVKTPVPTDMDAWRVATIEWLPDRLRFLWDGELVADVTDPAFIPVTPMRWTLQAETSIGAPAPAADVEAYVYVDWAVQWSRTT